MSDFLDDGDPLCAALRTIKTDFDTIKARLDSVERKQEGAAYNGQIEVLSRRIDAIDGTASMRAKEVQERHERLVARVAELERGPRKPMFSTEPIPGWREKNLGVSTSNGGSQDPIMLHVRRLIPTKGGGDGLNLTIDEARWLVEALKLRLAIP